jgi:FAD/FMN-containing dehydrogenase
MLTACLVGGLGPSSRLWGAALDHIEEVEIVLADSTIKRCSATQNSDIFWAVKGAGASFGVVTEFVLRTEPEPGEAVHFSYSFTVGSYASFAAVFKSWQKFVADPGLTRKFASELIITGAGLIISGTYFGSKAEYDAFDMKSKIGGESVEKTLVFKDWLGLLGHWAEEIGLRLGGGLPAPLYAKTLTFNGCHLIPDTAIDKVFAYLDKAKKGTLVWFVIFDLAGGAVNDVAQDATSYAHRDALFYLQSYAVGLGKVSKTTKDFLGGINTTIKDGMPGSEDFGAYAGYVDPELVNGPQEYWRTNLPRLENIKAVVDPGDVFHNPQSVNPAGSEVKLSKAVVGKPAKRRSLLARICRLR